MRLNSQTLLLLLGLSSVACAAAQTTPAGPLGKMDLGTKLPEGVAKGPDDPSAEHQRSAEVCAGDGAPGVQVKVRWETFSKGENRYIASYAVELTKPVEGVVVKLGEPGPTAGGDPDAKPYIGATKVVVTCTREGSGLKKDAIPIRADGK